MRKVLLVDDEPYILQGLKSLIDWEAEGFEVRCHLEGIGMWDEVCALYCRHLQNVEE